MADISQYTDKIRHAVYGKEVRGSLADGIEAINTEVEANTKHVNDTSTDIQNFKSEINQAESTRVQDENERKSSESNRVTEFNSIKNQFDTLKNNSTEATNNANAAATNANSTATNSENKTNQAINDLTTKVNNAIVDVKANQIGGTNLLSGTQFFDCGWQRCDGTAVKIDRTNLFQGCAVQEQWDDWNYFCQVMCYEINERYTISCYAKCDKQGGKIYFTLADNMTAWGVQDLTTEWKRYVFSFTPTEGKGTLRIECSNIDSTNKSYISKIKLEKGSIATDWSPNPSDYQTEIGGSNLLLNTGLDNQIDVIEKTGNFNFAIFNKNNGVQAIYNEKFLFLDNADPFGDAYATLFKTVDYSLIPNSMYTASFIYKCQYTGDTPSTSSYIKLVLNDDSIRWLQINDIDFKNSAIDWKVSKFTFEVPSNIKRVELRLGFVTNKYGWFAINGIKLEKGLTATDWCPNYKDITDKATIENAPDCKDCNWFLEPNSSFVWDTGLGIFKNTPIGDLAKDSGIVFEVINYGTEGRIQQEFRKTYPLSETRTWIRSYSSDNGGQWTDWKSEFIGENQVGTSDDFNNLTRMGCWKVQSIDGNTPNSPLKLDSNIYNFGLLNVYESGVAEEHRVLQIYYPHQVGGVGHKTPLMRMLNSGSWTAWDYIGATSKDIADLKDSCTTLSTKATSNRNDINTHTQQISSCRNDINTHTQQIASNSGSIQEIKNYWIATGDNRLCINGRSEIDVYAGGFYYLQGNSVTELHKIDHSRLVDGQSIFFCAETLDQVANIKFCRDDLVHWGVYTPAGKDFWITGRDNGDTIFEMKKMNGTLRFLGMR